MPDPGGLRGYITRGIERQLREYKGYYDDPKWLEKEKEFKRDTRAGLMPGSLDAIQNDGPGYEATGSLNVNVRGPRGTSVKAEGTGPFETVNMT